MSWLFCPREVKIGVSTLASRARGRKLGWEEVSLKCQVLAMSRMPGHLWVLYALLQPAGKYEPSSFILNGSSPK